MAVAARRRMHPRDRARSLRIQRAALRQHELHLEPRQAAPAAQSASPAARVRVRGDDRPGKTRSRNPRPFHGLRHRGRRGRSGPRLPLAGRAFARADFCLRAGHRARRSQYARLPLAALHHARRRRGPHARRHPARGIACDERNPRHRRRDLVGFRLYRSRPHPFAVEHRAGDHQIADVQRGPATAARRGAS